MQTYCYNPDGTTSDITFCRIRAMSVDIVQLKTQTHNKLVNVSDTVHVDLELPATSAINLTQQWTTIKQSHASPNAGT
jgi:hypothetical protein